MHAQCESLFRLNGWCGLVVLVWYQVSGRRQEAGQCFIYCILLYFLYYIHMHRSSYMWGFGFGLCICIYLYVVCVCMYICYVGGFWNRNTEHNGQYTQWNCGRTANANGDHGDHTHTQWHTGHGPRRWFWFFFCFLFFFVFWLVVGGLLGFEKNFILHLYLLVHRGNLPKGGKRAGSERERERKGRGARGKLSPKTTTTNNNNHNQRPSCVIYYAQGVYILH